MNFYPSILLKTRILNKALRILHRNAPARLFQELGAPGGPALERLGSDYGGWFVPREISSNWVVYSLGIGQDASFDRAVIERHGVTVHGFDPTPTAVAYVTEWRTTPPILTERFNFTPVGVWDSDCTLRFYEPKTRGWVGSYSALNLQGTDRYIEVPCRTLLTLMGERGHRHIDLLKMDIEGAEYRVLNAMIEHDTPVHWLCVEFDQPVPLATTRAMIKRLNGRGFLLRHVDRWNFTFENTSYAA